MLYAMLAGVAHEPLTDPLLSPKASSVPYRAPFDDPDTPCWHEITVTPFTDPGSGTKVRSKHLCARTEDLVVC